MAEPQSLPAMVRAKYPGVYDDLSDVELDAKVRAKYPGTYDDLPKPVATAPRESHMSAAVSHTAIAADDPNILAVAIGPKTRKTLDTPLAHTGVDAVDKLTTPANLTITAATLALGAERAAALPAKNILLKAKAALTAVAETAAPAIKYEVAKSALEAIHVPPALATVIAMGVSGYKSKSSALAQSAPVEAAPVETPTPARAPRQAPREPGPIPEGIGRPKSEGTTLETTRRLKAENQAKYAAASPAAEGAPTAAAPESVPAGSAPPRAAAPATTAMWKELRAAGLSPTEAQEAYRHLSQGMAPEAVQAKILAARPQPASVAPELSPVQRAVNIRPGVAPSPTQIDSALGIAARRAKVTLTAEDMTALKPLIKQGITPEEAISRLPALKLQQLPGTLTDDQVAAEIAARKGNRSPKRD